MEGDTQHTKKLKGTCSIVGISAKVSYHYSDNKWFPNSSMKLPSG